eukprot:PhM_4_TR2480/c1_g1_i6/m.33886
MLVRSGEVELAVDEVSNWKAASTEAIDHIASELCNNVEFVDRTYYRLEARKSASLPILPHVFHMIILACAHLGDVQRAVETLEAMDQFDGVAPDEIAFLYCIQARGYTNNRAANTERLFEQIIERKVVLATDKIPNRVIEQLPALRVFDKCLEHKTYPDGNFAMKL